MGRQSNEGDSEKRGTLKNIVSLASGIKTRKPLYSIFGVGAAGVCTSFSSCF